MRKNGTPAGNPEGWLRDYVRAHPGSPDGGMPAGPIDPVESTTQSEGRKSAARRSRPPPERPDHEVRTRPHGRAYWRPIGDRVIIRGMSPTIHLAQQPEADELLGRSPLAALVGMLLDQQVPMEWAFSGPYTIAQRLGARRSRRRPRSPRTTRTPSPSC